MIHILHVDDDPDFRSVAAKLLEREDDRFDVVTESNAGDGLARLQDGDIDCIVSDYQMPEQDGIAFLAAVREDHPDLPFILFTGRGSEEVASEAIQAGASDYIQKQGGTDQYTILANRIVNSVEKYRALRQTRLTYQTMETATEGLSLVESDGTFSYVNRSFADLFGYESEELLDRHWTVLYHDEEATRLENDILPAVRETGYWSGETVRQTKNGERLITDHRLALTDDDAIVCTAQDVTDERSGDVAQTTEFDLLIDAMDDYAFFTLDHEGYITRWNEGAKRLKGYEGDEIIGKHISKFFTEIDRHDDLPEQLLETAKTDGSVTDEGWRLRSDGTRFWAEVTISASYDDSGTLRGFGKVTKETAEPPTVQ